MRRFEVIKFNRPTFNFYPRGNFYAHGACAFALLCAFVAQAFAVPIARVDSNALPVAPPARVGMSAEHLARIDEIVQASIARHEMPGAVVLIGRRGSIVFRKSYGSRAVQPSAEAMTDDTIFDLASLTKIVATATSIMILIERGQVRLHDPLVKFFPEFKNTDKGRITIEQLLTHESGFAPDFDLREQWSGYDEAIRRLANEKLQNPPGAKFVYSDLNFITLGEIVHRASGKMLNDFARANIYEPLGMKDTGFRPFDLSQINASTSKDVSRIAPTETLRNTRRYLGGDQAPTNAANKPEEALMLRGMVHDPTAFRMGGVAGHAGLFSTASDLAIYCQMILNGGEVGGVRILSPLSVQTMTRPRFVHEENSPYAARGLGWDIATRFSSNRGDIFPLGSFGHTGFTGTSIWIDPSSQTFVIFLSNRVHPEGRGDVTAVRGEVASIAASSIVEMSAQEREAWRELQASFMTTMSASQTITNSRAVPNSAVGAKATANNRAASDSLNAEVLNGIDVLERDGFKELQNLHVGLVTNHTGRNRAGRQTIDILRDAEGVKLVALFSPEHGIRGQADEKVSDSKDERTGLPIYSLYGERRRPTPGQLKNLDAIVFDIQDVGARFYTYISTLGAVLEEAAKARIPVFVLDRPNPINGVDVEGAIADADKLSFIAYHRLPIRHGMTVGELARLFNDERKLNCDLRVIKMEHWQRAMWFDGTQQTWVNPSPNMRSLTEATLYPGIGLLETTNISVGRGTDTPFEIIGAPFIDGVQLAKELNEKNLAGVRFVPVRFTPKVSTFKNQECGGVNIIITNRAAFQPVRVGIEIALALRRLYPNEWRVDDYNKLLVNAATLERIKRGDSASDIIASWSQELENFKRARARALLY
jgi:uncharacterized protein YbbC (DUF1343 family)/CubicO group peptidase (beta-lactamase class C family)